MSWGARNHMGMLESPKSPRRCRMGMDLFIHLAKVEVLYYNPTHWDI